MELVPYLSTGPLALSGCTSRCCIRAAVDEDTKVHQYWAYPLNGIVSLIGIGLQPICSLINLIVAGILKLIAQLTDSKKLDLEARVNLLVGLKSLHALFTLFVRIFYPAFALEIMTDPTLIRFNEGRQREIQHVRERIPGFLKENQARVDEYRRGEGDFNGTFSDLVYELQERVEKEIGPERLEYLDEIHTPKGYTSGETRRVINVELFKAISIETLPELTQELKGEIEAKMSQTKQDIAQAQCVILDDDAAFKSRAGQITLDIMTNGSGRKNPWAAWWHVRNMVYAG